MNNNDVLRRLRYTFNFNDKKMVSIFSSAGEEVTREKISQWLKKETDSDFVVIPDTKLAVFLNGFINEKRGKKPGANPVPEKRLSNNIILTKLKIALNLQADEVIVLLNSVNFNLGKAELSAFSRKTDHKHYRECKDQVLRNLLQAIDKKYHVERTVKITSDATTSDCSPKSKHKKKSDSNKKTAKEGSVSSWIEGARPNASKIYVNPNNAQEPKRQKLKLSK